MDILNIAPEWYESVLKLNNAHIPAVSKINEEDLKCLINHSKYAWMILDQKKNILIGFCIIFKEGTSYRSINYQWVSNFREKFDYLDRVVISDQYQRQGHGKRFYEKWINETSSNYLLLEVNIEPKNETSLSFHDKLGFKSVGEQNTDQGLKRVRYLEMIK